MQHNALQRKITQHNALQHKTTQHKTTQSEINHILTGTGLPHLLGIPVRHSSSNNKINAASSSLFLLLAKWSMALQFHLWQKSLALQFHFGKQVGTPVPPEQKSWHSSSMLANKLALQFHQNKKVGTSVPSERAMQHSSSMGANKTGNGTHLPPLKPELQRPVAKSTIPLATPCLKVDTRIPKVVTNKKNVRSHGLRHVINIKLGGARRGRWRLAILAGVAYKVLQGFAIQPYGRPAPC